MVLYPRRCPNGQSYLMLFRYFFALLCLHSIDGRIDNTDSVFSLSSELMLERLLICHSINPRNELWDSSQSCGGVRKRAAIASDNFFAGSETI